NLFRERRFRGRGRERGGWAKSAHSPCPRTLAGALHFEAVAGAAIPIGGGHAANHMQLFAVDAESFRIDEVIANMSPFHQADDETVIADLQSAPLRAFEAGWRGGDPGRANDGGWLGCQAILL